MAGEPPAGVWAVIKSKARSRGLRAFDFVFLDCPKLRPMLLRKYTEGDSESEDAALIIKCCSYKMGGPPRLKR